MKIEKMILKNYKSYNVEGAEISFTPITGLIGSNSSGKSNILEALNLFFNPQKLSIESFHKRHNDTPISIEVSFSNNIFSANFPAKILTNKGCFSLRQQFVWNENKGEAEPEKEKRPSAIWKFKKNQQSILDPFPMNPPLIADIRKFFNSPASDKFKERTGLIDPPAVTIYMHKLRNYWEQVSIESDEWKEYFQWEKVEDGDKISKALKESIATIKLPLYVYLPIEYSVEDEMSLKKGSRMEELFSYLFKFTDIQNEKRKKDLGKIKTSIDKYFQNYYDNPIRNINQKLNTKDHHQWNFSESELTIERKENMSESLFQPTWHMVVNDGFESDIATKGNGMQRLAVFQLLQSYVDYRKKQSTNQNVILAIEEPEIYLHPPYKRALYAMLRALSKEFQICYTTHDPVFVNLEYFDEIRLIKKNSNQESNVTYVQWDLFESDPLWKDVFGRKKNPEAKRNELKNKCHDEQNEGFFADKVILVEGNTEKYALPIYFEKLGFNLDRKNIVLIPAFSVDAIKPIYAIFAAFGIPVYVIFDGDKPKEDTKSIFSKIEPKKKQYLRFCENIEKYCSQPTQDTLKKLRKQTQKISDILPQNFKNELFEENCAAQRIRSIYHSSKMLTKHNVNSIDSQRNRDVKLQYLLGEKEPRIWEGTIIHNNYTMWEYEFEESISKGLVNYEKIKQTVAPFCQESKPLTAKTIAARANVSDYSEQLKATLMAIIENIKRLQTSKPLNEYIEAKPHRKNPYQVQLFSSLESGQCGDEIRVFSCAGGPLNPLADKPVYYAKGTVPDGTQYIIKITGTSMEPEIPDGALVPVQAAKGEIESNKIGVFCHNGNSICKKYVKTGEDSAKLVSLNKEYDPINLKEDDRLDFYGYIITDKVKKAVLIEEIH